MPPTGVFLFKVNQHVITSAKLKPHLFQITGCLRQNAYMSFVEIIPYVFEAPFSFLEDDLVYSAENLDNGICGTFGVRLFSK